MKIRNMYDIDEVMAAAVGHDFLVIEILRLSMAISEALEYTRDNTLISPMRMLDKESVDSVLELCDLCDFLL